MNVTINTNLKSTIGGAFSALGSALMGIGIVPQLSGVPSKALTYVALAGFVCNAIGSFLGHLFAADAKTVSDLKDVVAQNTAALQATPAAIQSGDTSVITKAMTSTTANV